MCPVKNANIVESSIFKAEVLKKIEKILKTSTFQERKSNEKLRCLLKNL